MKVSSELPPPSRESNGKRSRQSSRSESTHSNRKGSSIRSSRATNKADPLDILKAENDKMEEIKEEIKPQVIDREAIEEEETRKILKSFERRQVAKEQPPPLPPRTRKMPCYNCRISGMISSVPFLSDNFNNPGAMVR